MKVVNLSRRPFVNSRPVVRVALILWVLGALFLGTNFWLYGSYWIESADIRRRLADVESTIREEEKGLSELDQRFQDLDLEDLNEQAAFLNRLIASRTFPWSALFDHLEEVLPRGVKLESVQPSLPGNDSARRRPARSANRQATNRRGARRPPPTVEESGPSEVQLSLVGSARSGEELLAFVDALYGHASFRQPMLRSERLDSTGGAGGTVRFDLTALYLVDTMPVGEEITAIEGTADEGTAAEVGAMADGGSPDAAGSDDGDAFDVAADAAGADAGTPGSGLGSPSAGTPTTVGDAPRLSRDEEGEATAEASGRPSAGSRSSSSPGRPDPSRPDPSRPDPSRSVPTLPAAGTLMGTPSAGIPSAEAPGSGQPSTDRPAPGRPAPDSTSSGESRGPRFINPSASDTPRLGGGGPSQ